MLATTYDGVKLTLVQASVNKLAARSSAALKQVHMSFYIILSVPDQFLLSHRERHLTACHSDPASLPSSPVLP